MKLFLSSYVIADESAQAFYDLVGKPKDQIKMAWIQNAKDVYEDTSWVDSVGKILQKHAAHIDVIDLREYDHNPEQIEKDLAGYDVVWIGGGNSFYLRWLLRKSGFDQAIKNLLSRGVVYGGDSAGAIVAGPTLNGFEIWEDAQKAPELVLDGMNLTDVVIVPHLDNPKYGDIPATRLKYFQDQGANVIGLNDDEAVIIIDGEVTELKGAKK